jgi:hypothetical protein
MDFGVSSLARNINDVMNIVYRGIFALLVGFRLMIL